MKLSGGGLPGRYIFQQFHFHWGSETNDGAEHLVAKKRHFGEIHFVHFKEEYGPQSNQVRTDALAVMGFFLEVDVNSPNGALDDLIQNEIGYKLLEPGSSMDIDNVSVGAIMPTSFDKFYRYQKEPHFVKIRDFFVYLDIWAALQRHRVLNLLYGQGCESVFTSIILFLGKPYHAYFLPFISQSSQSP